MGGRQPRERERLNVGEKVDKDFFQKWEGKVERGSG